jgi:prenyltransferase beta subunit
VVADLKKAVSANGSIASSSGNTFDYAWAILGLATNNQTKLANSVAKSLVSLQRPDGGFGMDQTGDTTKSSADATGIALQALSLAKRSASKSQVSIQQNSIIAASKYLRATQVTSNHWEAWGDVDVNGTAYAAMGLKAAGGNISAIQGWLKTRVAPTGGLTTPWSNGQGDVFATAQGYVPLMGMSYLNLIPVKK